MAAATPSFVSTAASSAGTTTGGRRSGGLFLLMVYKTSNGGAACVQSIRPLLFIRLFSDFLSGKKTTPY
jgi:hypothetical protein